jgi:hypothetical protein
MNNNNHEDNNSKKIKLYILTPCYGGMCHVNYVIKIIETKEILKNNNIDCEILFMKNESLITRARNNLIARAMNDINMTHILFIDSDITWNPNDIIKLLNHDKDLCGGAYPKKNYNWNKLNNINNILDKKKIDFNNNISDINFIYQNLMDYNINNLSNNININNNLLEVYTLATGFMMIKRNCIEKMIEKYNDTKYIDDIGYFQNENNNYTYALFDCGIVKNHYFSEDWMFCHRWKELGGSIWLDVSINLTHTGNEDYKGRYLSSLNIKL